MHKVLKMLKSKEIAIAMEEHIANKFEGFLKVRDEYSNALIDLRNGLSEKAAPSVDDVEDAIMHLMSSNLFFYGALGLKANLDHFNHPTERTFMDVDFEEFLQEATARRIPEYEQAQNVLTRFYGTLSQEQRIMYDPIIEYISYMETVSPKLAHYYGYLLGNEILYHLIPGYRPDNLLTLKYRAMLEDYLEIDNLCLEEGLLCVLRS